MGGLWRRRYRPVAANQIVFIGGAGDDTATLQNGMTEDEVGNVFAIGGRGQFVFDLDMTGTSGFAGDDTRTVPNMFSVLTLGNASTFDYELAPEFSTDDAVPVLVTVNDRSMIRSTASVIYTSQTCQLM